MTWLSLSLLSAILLGVYDIARKSAVQGNAVAPVLLLNVSTAALLWLPWIVLSHVVDGWLPHEKLRVHSIGWETHGLLFAKSALVGASWTFGFVGMKHLPISIAAPIRSSSPLWTILIATTLMGERPEFWQWVGVSVVLISFYAFSLTGLREGIHFRRNRWVGCMLAATLLGSLSALYDKYLLNQRQLSAATVQSWFSVYLVLVMIPLTAYWYFNERPQKPLVWRWVIPMVAVLLLLSDFLYFEAIGLEDARISLISPVRRSSMIIPFLAGTIFMGDKNWQRKGVCIAGLILGIFLLSR